jgi:hypothetical protein
MFAFDQIVSVVVEAQLADLPLRATDEARVREGTATSSERRTRLSTASKREEMRDILSSPY